ncbi:glycosyltransferase family 39 protein [bacterium]|nr:glycosyltransferase family 39 protein [bacterium]
MLVHALSIGYIFEGEHSKITAVIFLISTLITLYNMVLKNGNHTLAILSIFLLCIIPDFMGQSALIASNPVSACYILIGLGFFDQYLKSKENSTFLISMLALAFTIWTRTEAVIFAVPLFFLLINRNDIKSCLPKLFTLTLFTLVPFTAWQLFIKSLSSLSSSQPVIRRLFLDIEKLTDLLGQIIVIIFNTETYALGFFFILFAVLTNMIFFKKSKATHAMTFILIVSFVMYVWVYYQLDTDYKIIHVGSWIGSGFKRGLFYFLPIGCYYIGNSFLIQKLLGQTAYEN